ncbi:MAG: hypothetical protein BRC26_03555 [Nanohaloarchaea archaeon QH_8_44_6]|nr:MAG: hypothetical protein BRC26_03555 [Nanohaloarchaea archaeon QH_8_44_6]
MRTKLYIAAIAFALLAAPAAAQEETPDEADPGPGLISSGSMIYGLETAYDNAAMNAGLKKAGNVAQERAAEARQASENNNTRGVEKAARELEKTADKAKDSDEEGINKAMQMMQETIQNAPNAQARHGMQTALQNMQEAQQKRQEGRQQADQQNRDAGSNQQERNPDQSNRSEDSGDNRTQESDRS